MDANEQRGELGFEVEGQAYVLRLGINAICTLEQKAGKPFDAVIASITRGEMQSARLVLWAALQAHHAAEVTTVEQAGDLMDRAGGTPVLVVKVRALLERLIALNQPPEELTKGQPVDPLLAPAGTGPAST